MSDMYVYMYVCMHVCTKSFLKTTTNSSCVCTHLANKADSDSENLIVKHYHNDCIVFWETLFWAKFNAALKAFFTEKANIECILI